MEEKSSPEERKKGGMITMPFIFANEVCDKLAVVGFNANMVSYLTTELHMPLTKAANTITNFGGTSCLTPLLGAFIADAYAGRFWTITVASLIYVVGMSMLTLQAILPQLRPPPCKGDQMCQEANWGQLAILYGCLLLNALGAGGIRPCVVAFGADQFNETDPKQSTKTWTYFNWYYFVMGVSMLFAVTIVVYIQDNIGWDWGFGIPAILMLVSVVLWVAGYRLYRMLEPDGSPFTRLIQVSVAAYRKRKLSIADPELLYQNDDLDASISIDGKLLHSKNLEFLDKAAIVTSQDDTKSPNLWRLNTVHRVEELKTIIRMGPIWATGILLYTSYVQQNTFSLQQAKTMDRYLTKSFQIPAGSMTLFTYTTMISTIVLYDRFLIRIARQFTGLDRGITFLHRMGIGFLISIIATLVASFLEVKRKKVAEQYGLLDAPYATIPLSVFWLVPQYGLHGMAEAFMAIGHLEFFYDQAPESMRSTATAMFWTTIAAGNYMSTLLVTLIHKYSAKPDGTNWLPNNNLNRGKLEYFYWLLTFLQIINFIYYVGCIRCYTFKPIQLQSMKASDNSRKDDEVELTNRV